jgi:hypothetical protein
MYSDADVALHSARMEGRSRIGVFAPQMREADAANLKGATVS